MNKVKKSIQDLDEKVNNLYEKFNNFQQTDIDSERKENWT
jgi:uncharacterized coiled-coil protein SlyX